MRFACGDGLVLKRKDWTGVIIIRPNRVSTAFVLFLLFYPNVQQHLSVMPSPPQVLIHVPYVHSHPLPLSSAGGTKRAEIIRKQVSQMLCGALAFTDAVRAVGIAHHLELLALFYQFVNQHFGSLVMHVVVAGAVNDQQVAAKVFGVGDG